MTGQEGSVQDRLSSSRLKFRIASRSWERGSGVVGVVPADALRPASLDLTTTGLSDRPSCGGGGGGTAATTVAGWDVGRSFTCRVTASGFVSVSVSGFSFNSTLLVFRKVTGLGDVAGGDVVVGAAAGATDGAGVGALAGAGAGAAAGAGEADVPFTITLELLALSCSCCSLASIRSLKPVRRKVF